MFDEMPAPMDSSDLYQMGLRPARCNGCEHARLKHELGDKFLSLVEDGWIVIYELDASPSPGQGLPVTHEDHSIRYHVTFMAIGHSDECYSWQPPK